MSDEDAFFEWSKEEALQRIADGNIDELWFQLPDILRVFGMTKEELLKELQSGRMVASGERAGHDWKHVAVRGDHLLQWMQITGRRMRKLQ